MDLGGPKEAQVQSFSPGGATQEGTWALPGEYDWTVRLRRRCGLMSNYFDHLLFIVTPYNVHCRVQLSMTSSSGRQQTDRQTGRRTSGQTRTDECEIDCSSLVCRVDETTGLEPVWLRITARDRVPPGGTEGAGCLQNVEWETTVQVFWHSVVFSTVWVAVANDALVIAPYWTTASLLGGFSSAFCCFIAMHDV